MKIVFLLCAVLLTQTQAYVPVGDASKYIGKTIKLNCKQYQTLDDGRTVTFILEPDRPAKPVMISLSGEPRKKLLTDMRDRRKLNREIASSLDTSLTATGKIILIKGHLTMVVSRSPDIYLGADLQIQRP
nr:hypothetical protein [Mucilaginibacter sp. L294]